MSLDGPALLLVVEGDESELIGELRAPEPGHLDGQGEFPVARLLIPQLEDHVQGVGRDAEHGVV